MPDVVIWSDAEGCHVTTPVPGIVTANEILDNLADHGIPAGANAQVADSANLPTFRDFRAAWRQNGATVVEDITAAREVFRARLRRARTPILQQLDGDLAAAIDNGDTAAEAQIRARKARLRDAPADPRIDNATNVDALRALDLLS